MIHSTLVCHGDWIKKSLVWYDVFQADTLRGRQHSKSELQAATGGPLHGPEESQPDAAAGQQQRSHDKAPATFFQKRWGPTSYHTHRWVHRTTASPRSG